MNVEQLIRELEKYPGYWNVEISIDRENSAGVLSTNRTIAREVTDRQHVLPALGSASPVVVIR